MVVQLRLLSEQVRLGSRVRHFAPSNSGQCELCHGGEAEDLAYLLVPLCLTECAQVLKLHMRDVLKHSEKCTGLLDPILTGSEADQILWIQFVFDCSVLPPVILTAQSDPAILGYLFHALQTYCYSLHRTRLKLLGR